MASPATSTPVLRYTLLAATLLLCQCSIVKKNPASMDAASFAAPDGKVMPYTRWPKPVEAAKPTEKSTKELKAKAAVICVHGLSGAASDFWPAGEALSKDGMVVYGMQLRGMGNDPVLNERGDLRREKQWTDDLIHFTEIVRQRHPGIPVYWYGESLGSLIVLHTLEALPDQRSLVDGVIFSSPVIAFRNDLPWWKYMIVRGMVAVRPGKRISLESLGDGEVKVTAKTTHKEQMEKTPHYVEYFTLRLFRVVDKMIRASTKAARKVQVPVLVFYTPNDVFTSPEQVEKFFREIPVIDKDTAFFPNSYHLLLHDVDREKVVKDLQKWLHRQIEN